MGSPSSELERSDDEGPVHEVCMDDFYMGKYEVTQAEYEKISGENPSRFKVGGDYPVEQVSWEEAQLFINKLNDKSGSTYRLPTEAEWEYGARANTTTPFSFGDTISTSQANYNSKYIYGKGREGAAIDRTTRVGTYAPNEFGLYNMHGNVMEWVSDWYGEKYYSSSPRQNPTGPSEGTERVYRGGDWYHAPYIARSGDRHKHSGDLHKRYLGFRLLLPVNSTQ
jgi:formylglycine-generating enzyme required for sulfatase activity